MTAPTLVTVEAYRVDDLTPSARDRLLDRERIAAWETWVTDEVTGILTDYLRDRLDGVDGVEVGAWGIDPGAGAVVEADVVNPRALARSLGLPDEDRPLRLDPYYGRGSQWAGTTGVLVEDDDGYETSPHEAASAALADLIRDALDEARAWADDVTSDAAILDGLRDGDLWYDRRGDLLIDVAEVTP